MEKSEAKPTGILSQSALHAFITGPALPKQESRSSFNPYRNRSVFLSIVRLSEAEKLLEQAVAREDALLLRAPESSPPSSFMPLSSPQTTL